MSPRLVDLTDFGRVSRDWASSRDAKHVSIPVPDALWHRAFKLGGKTIAATEGTHLAPLVRSVLYRLGNVPLPLSTADMWAGRDPLTFITQVREFAQHHEDETVEDFASSITEIIDQYPTHPLWDAAMAESATIPRPSCIIVNRASWVAKVEPFADKLLGAPIVICPEELEDMRFRSSAIIFGRPSSYPAWMKAMPRLTSYWVHFTWQRPPEPPGTFLEFGTSTLPPMTVVTREPRGAPAQDDPPSDDKADLADPIDWRELKRHLERTRSQAAQDDDVPVEAIAAVIADDRVILLAAEGNATVYDPDAGSVQLIKGSEVRAGLFVVIREGTDRDYFRAVVESRFLTDAQQARKGMELWKRTLRRWIRSSGLSDVSAKLRYRGVSVVPGTVRTWATDVVYGPSKFEWFRTLLLELGLDDYEEQWNVLEAYRLAGVKAGHYLKQKLLEQLDRMDPRTVRHESTLHFTLDGELEGGLVAYKVESVNPERVAVGSSSVGSIVRLGD